MLRVTFRHPRYGKTLLNTHTNLRRTHAYMHTCMLTYSCEYTHMHTQIINGGGESPSAVGE